MKDFAIRIFKNPAVRKAFVGLLLALAAAAGLNAAGCSAAIDQAQTRIDQAQAQLAKSQAQVDAVQAQVDCVQMVQPLEPETMTLPQAQALAKALRDCLRGTAGGSDAGAQ